MIVKVWKLVSKRFCDLCQKDITNGNSYARKYDDGSPEEHYCSDECGKALKTLHDKKDDHSIENTEGGHQMNNKG